MALDDQAKQAFTAVSDWTKQILTLSTGIVTLTIAFADKIFGALSTAEKAFLYIGWVIYAIAILAGVMVLGGLAGALGKTSDLKAEDVYGWNVRLFAMIQLGGFFFGTVALIIFGFLAVANK
jgi:hypothetical protein